MKMKTKQDLLLENEKLKTILKQIYEDCYLIGTYWWKNRIKKKNIVDWAWNRYYTILNEKEKLGI